MSAKDQIEFPQFLRDFPIALREPQLALQDRKAAR